MHSCRSPTSEISARARFFHLCVLGILLQTVLLRLRLLACLSFRPLVFNFGAILLCWLRHNPEFSFLHRELFLLGGAGVCRNTSAAFIVGGGGSRDSADSWSSWCHVPSSDVPSHVEGKSHLMSPKRGSSFNLPSPDLNSPLVINYSWSSLVNPEDKWMRILMLKKKRKRKSKLQAHNVKTFLFVFLNGWFLALQMRGRSLHPLSDCLLGWHPSAVARFLVLLKSEFSLR